MLPFENLVVSNHKQDENIRPARRNT